MYHRNGHVVYYVSPVVRHIWRLAHGHDVYYVSPACLAVHYLTRLTNLCQPPLSGRSFWPALHLTRLGNLCQVRVTGRSCWPALHLSRSCLVLQLAGLLVRDVRLTKTALAFSVSPLLAVHYLTVAASPCQPRLAGRSCWPPRSDNY